MKKKTVSRIKYNRELYVMARKVMNLPYNREGADKSYVLRAIFFFNDFYAKVRKHAGP